MAADRAAAGAAISATAKNEYHSDLQIYVPESKAKATGFSYALYPWSYGKKSSFDFGFGWTSISDYEGTKSECPAGMTTCASPTVTTGQHRSYSFFGMPFRLIIPVSKLAFADFEVDWNWLGLGKNSNPNLSHASMFRAGLTLNPHPQVFLRGGGMARNTKQLGVSLEAGVRF